MAEIETLEEFDRRAATSATMHRWQVQDLDLRERDDVLLRLDPRGALFLGCQLSEGAGAQLRAGGALVFPKVPHVPFNPYRATLYTATELYAGIAAGYSHTPDAQIYAWWRRSGSGLERLLAQSLHDNAIDDALAEFAQGRRIVGVMGGHALTRADPSYADAARLGHSLASRGLTVATGGGPGAMEAANLGARLCEQPVELLEQVLGELASVPRFEDVTSWAGSALGALGELPDSGRSLGVPTWFYGHEPPNPAASRIAKYFRNAIREDVLIGLCKAGIVFLPGAAGTVQEIFQSACANYYAEADHVAPMVLVGRDQWERELPAWPLVSALAGTGALAPHLHLLEHPEAVPDLLAPPAPPHPHPR